MLIRVKNFILNAFYIASDILLDRIDDLLDLLDNLLDWMYDGE